MGSRLNLIKTSFFIACVVLYAAVQASRLWNYAIPAVINSYLSDIVCIPIVIILITTSIRLTIKQAEFWPSLEMTLTLTLLFSLFFELTLPHIDTRHTADKLDIVCYFIGLILFQIFKQQETKTRK